MVKFELRHLRYVLAVAENSSFRGAARALQVQPSTISRRIRDLEDNLGAALFIRDHGGVSPTIAGERFIQKTRKALNELTDATLDVGVVGRGQAGVVTIGLMSSMASGFISILLDAYGADHSGIQIHFIEGDASGKHPRSAALSG